MPAHVCDSCGSVVGSDDQFCPSCGAWIDPTESRDAVSNEDDFESFSLSDEPPPTDIPTTVRVPRNEIPCPSCGTSNPASNRHCEECGARLSQGALPVAPRPAVQTTAGVRAAMAISGLLLGVVVIAVLFNIFTGDETDTTDADAATTSTTTTTTITPDVIPILDADCSVEGLANFLCDNLIDGTSDREYQINWETLDEGQDVVVELKFAEPMVITSFRWENLPADSDRFFQNYRARDVIVSDGSPNSAGLGIRLDNQGGEQTVPYASLRTLELTITITSAYEPEPRNNTVFSELAVADIRVVGYPASAVATTTTTTEAGDEG